MTHVQSLSQLLSKLQTTSSVFMTLLPGNGLDHFGERHVERAVYDASSSSLTGKEIFTNLPSDWIFMTLAPFNPATSFNYNGN